MVARSDMMFGGCYDSYYSYKLWSLANVWHSVQLPGALNGLKPEPEELSPGQEYFMKCPQCQKGYQTYQGLKDHIESSHGDLLSMENGSISSNPLSPTPLAGPGGPYACSQCSASFANKDQLEKHELLHSPNPQVFCKVCNKTFANVYRLQRHMISHDESAVLRKFKCTECDKAFKFKHHLKEHIRIHSGEKPFECGNCGKRFSHSGSYSSHMTSKKCLVMNLKLGRTRPPNTTNLDKSSPSQTRGPKRNSLNNNLATSPNQNGMFPILPKYTDAATAAALFNPFYISPPNMPMPPYSIPTIGEFLEKLQRVSPQTSGMNISEHDDRKMVESDGELDKTKSTSCGDLVMDEEEIDVKEEQEEKNSGDLEAVKRILETVNVSVTKQFLQANMQKYSSDTSDCNSVTSAQSPQQIFNCNSCKKTFSTQNYLEDHECDSSEVKSEGLAAKLEDALTTKSENDPHNGSFSGNSDEEYEKHHNDEEIDNERVATTDQLSDDGRKVRVRSLISDEQLKVLKDNYGINPRPKREDLMRIAEQIGFPVRVVQVWFQNTRARDRREGRLIQIPYNQPRFPTQTTQYLLPPTQYSSEQPLDLSIRKDSNPSPASSPWSSPRPASIHHSDSEDVVNLSHKSSRSPTPFQHSSYQNYQNSNCSSELRRSPSPIDFKNGQSRLAQILAQPSHKLHPIPGMSLVPMDRLMQFGNQELQNFSQMITNLSPSNKRCWSDDGDATQESVDDEMNSKRKVGQLVMKSLGSPMLGNQEEAEGQFGCDQCDKSFSKQSSLARHKYEHSGQRPHKCDECPKAFKHKHHLTEHKRLHSGEKPFQCSKCLKRFSHSGSYSQHMNHRYSYCKPYRE